MATSCASRVRAGVLAPSACKRAPQGGVTPLSFALRWCGLSASRTVPDCTNLRVVRKRKDSRRHVAKKWRFLLGVLPWTTAGSGGSCIAPLTANIAYGVPHLVRGDTKLEPLAGRRRRVLVRDMLSIEPLSPDDLLVLLSPVSTRVTELIKCPGYAATQCGVYSLLRVGNHVAPSFPAVCAPTAAHLIDFAAVASDGFHKVCYEIFVFPSRAAAVAGEEQPVNCEAPTGDCGVLDVVEQAVVLTNFEPLARSNIYGNHFPLPRSAIANSTAANDNA